MNPATTAVLLAALAVPASAAPQQAWSADLGDGRFQNPVLHADYSDPDVIRVGGSYYMTASSFNSVPGLPLLSSKDMVNWTLVGHALPRLAPDAHFSQPRYGEGVWAPCLRYHDGKFWIFYPDPDFGVYVTTAENFAGPWSEPHLLLPGKGIIDPTPLWDEDGKAWLLHAWAKSRAGFNNVLTLRAMAPDGKRLLDEQGTVVIDGNRLPGYRTLEGPKFYKQDGWYYVFAPAGGVEEGWQSVFRARRIEGPYEVRVVLEQGATPVNGPHQGAWVRAQDGSDWFFHFQDKQAYGRVVHLQPMQWKDGWPVMGQPGARPETGNPVAQRRKPVAGQPPAVPASSDEFDSASLGYQWQWNANPQPEQYSLSARPGWLRLHTQAAPAGPVRSASGILTQKLPAPAFTVDTKVELKPGGKDGRAGLILNALSSAWLGFRQQAGSRQLVFATCTALAVKPATAPLPACTEQQSLVLDDAPALIYLRLQVRASGEADFYYSKDGQDYVTAGTPVTLSRGRWVGAQMGLFSVGVQQGGYFDVDYFRVRP
jgi:beta-xylosidase